MALPADLSTFTLRGKYKDFEGNPLYGNDESVTVTYPSILNDAAETTTLVPREITRALDSTGSFSMVIPVTTDPDLTPTGFSIAFKENFAGGRTLNFVAPDGVGTIWISSFSGSVPADEGTVVYATFAQLVASELDQMDVNEEFDTRLEFLETTIGDDATQFVNTTGTQTIGGVKTFSLVPVLPGIDPATANQAARKAYVDSGDNAVATAAGNAITSAIGTAVLLTGAQSVAGLKTFSTIPEVGSSPTTANQLARKAYVDARALDSDVVKLTGAQTVAGVKTFSSLPEVGADPTTGNQLARKSWVDSAIASSGGGLHMNRVRITSDNLSGLVDAPAWQVVSTSTGEKLQCTLGGLVAGDWVSVHGAFMYVGSHFLDWVMLLGDGTTIDQFATSQSTSAPIEGDPTMYPSRTYGTMNSAPVFQVAAGNLSSGVVTIGLAHKGAAAGASNIVYAHTSYPWRLRLEREGQSV